jgi:hypothetical protein
MELPHNDFDGAWKEALEKYLQPLMDLCFPTVAAAVDWSVPVTWQDKELQEVFRGDELGGQQVDKLVKVRLRDGGEEWILLHIEAQSQGDGALPVRMYRYHHRLVDRYGSAVVSLAILADENRHWKPCVHTEELLGCRVRFEYPVCKLLEMEKASLEQSASGEAANPGAIILLACRHALETGKNLKSRRQWKWELTRCLYEGGFGKEEIIELYRLIGWFIALPEEMELQFHRRLVAYEEEKKMPYVTFAERYGRREGRKEGRKEGRREGRQVGKQEGRLQTLREGILDILDARFGEVPGEIREAITVLEDETRLKFLHRHAALAGSLEEFRVAM